MILDQDIQPLVAAVDAGLDARAASSQEEATGNAARLVALQDVVLRARRLAAGVFDGSDRPVNSEQFRELQSLSETLQGNTLQNTRSQPSATEALLVRASTQYIALVVYRAVAQRTLSALPETRDAQRYYERLDTSAWARLVYAVQTAPACAWREAAGACAPVRAAELRRLDVAHVRASALRTLRAVRKVRDLQFVGLGSAAGAAGAATSTAQIAWDAICAPGFFVHAQVRSSAHTLAAENDAQLARLGALLREFPEAYAADAVNNADDSTPLRQTRAVLAKYVGVNAPETAPLSAIVAAAAPNAQPSAQRLPTIPSVATRYWPLALLVLTQGPTALTSLYASRARIAAFLRDNVWGFLRGLVAHWLVAPLRDIWHTVRHDARSDLALAAAGSLETERASLCRMVVAAVRDSDPQLLESLGGEAALAAQVREGDLDAFMRVYEEQVSAPLRSAVSGRLLRSVLVQVQKTKVDGSLALGGIDRLLQSQQLLFAVVALSPALLLAYCAAEAAARLWRLRTLWSSAGECRARARASLAAVERLLNYAEFERAQPRLRDVHHALLVLEVSALARDGARLVPAGQWAREWARDVREMLDPGFSNGARLNVVRRVARVYARWFD